MNDEQFEKFYKKLDGLHISLVIISLHLMLIFFAITCNHLK